MSSFGDVAALSDTVDESAARLIKPEVCDAIIAPDYAPEALEILKTKREGFLILKMDPDYEPPKTQIATRSSRELEAERSGNTAKNRRDTGENGGGKKA